MIDWPFCFGPMVRQHTMVGVRAGVKVHTLELGSKTKKQGGTGIPQSSSRAYPQSPTDFLLRLSS